MEFLDLGFDQAHPDYCSHLVNELLDGQSLCLTLPFIFKKKSHDSYHVLPILNMHRLFPRHYLPPIM